MSKVTLRERPIAKGRNSLFLDIYPPVRNPKTGKLQRKYNLGLFVYDKPKDSLERWHNRETLELGRNQAAKRQIEVQNQQLGFLSKEMRNGNFLDLFQEEMDKRGNDSSLENWRNSIKYFKAFAGEKVRYVELNETFSEEYAAYLLSGPALGPKKISIKTNTAVAYFAKYIATLKVAFKKGLLATDLGEIIDPIRPAGTHREFLFLDELRHLARTPCPSDLVRRASLFSALTGLRFSDVGTLTWEETRGSRGNYFIQFSMEKTGVCQFHPIPDEAYDLLGDKGAGVIFAGLQYYHVTSILPKWLQAAGIERHFTFHCFRHTFATLQVLSRTEVATISKLLGHKNIQTTMIYVHIVDSLKREASHRIRLDISKDWQNLSGEAG